MPLWATLDHINPPCLFPSAFCDPGRWDGGRQAQAVALVLCLEQGSRCPPCSVSPAPIRVMLSTPRSLPRGESPARGQPAAICGVFFHLHPCSTSRSWAGAPQDGPKRFGCCPGEGRHRGVTGGKTVHYSPSISATAGLAPRDQQKALFSLPLPVIHQFYCSTKPPL